ncbi:MAG: serine hydrolase domain-containing protein [Chloroflexia bacterium]
MSDSGGPNSDFAQLSEQVQAAMQRFHVPGVAVGLIHGDAEYTAGFGVTSIENPLPVTPDTLFQIGSTTKTFTGTAAMRLAEQGKLDLDAPLRAYLPDLRLSDRSVAAGVTLRHLFTHTGGWVGDYFDDTGHGDDALALIVGRMADLPQLTPLGEVWSYNNSGFYLGGRVLEVVTGKPYEQAVQELVFDPLGMVMSFFFADDVIAYRVAIGHENPPDDDYQPRVARPWALPRAAHPAGGIISTVKDQLLYARFQMGDGAAPDGTRLLTSASLSEMQQPRLPAANGDFFGLTWFVRDVAGTRLVRHGGATNGQLSAFQMVPARRFALTILTNAEQGSLLNRDVVKWALDHYLGVREAEPETLELTAAQLAPYTGRYVAASGDLDLTLGDDGLITMQITPKGGFPKPDSPPPPAPPPVRLAFCGQDCVVVLDEPLKDTRGEFLRDPDAGIAWLRIGGRVHKHYSPGHLPQ